MKIILLLSTIVVCSDSACLFGWCLTKEIYVRNLEFTNDKCLYKDGEIVIDGKARSATEDEMEAAEIYLWKLEKFTSGKRSQKPKPLCLCSSKFCLSGSANVTKRCSLATGNTQVITGTNVVNTFAIGRSKRSPNDEQPNETEESMSNVDGPEISKNIQDIHGKNINNTMKIETPESANKYRIQKNTQHINGTDIHNSIWIGRAKRNISTTKAVIPGV